MAVNRCNECSSDFEWNFQLGQHTKRKHATPPPVDSSDSVKQPERHVCRLCLFCSDNKLSVYEHANIVHKRRSVHVASDHVQLTINETELKCDHCKYSTVSPLFLVRHHSTCPRKIIPCALCLTPSTFMVEEDNVLDLCIQTLEVEVYVCTDCPFRTPSKDDFVIHQFIHKGLAQLQAKVKIGSEEPNQTRQQGESTQGPFECQYCSRVFVRKEHMRRHIGSQHTATEDIVWYACEQCPAQYKRKEHLTRHVATSHAAPEDMVWFSCDVCPQRFKRKEHLKRHMLRGTHSDRNKGGREHPKAQLQIEIYQCGICPAQFKTNRGLQRHHGYMHNKFNDAAS